MISPPQPGPEHFEQTYGEMQIEIISAKYFFMAEISYSNVKNIKRCRFQNGLLAKTVDRRNATLFLIKRTNYKGFTAGRSLPGLKHYQQMKYSGQKLPIHIHGTWQVSILQKDINK